MWLFDNKEFTEEQAENYIGFVYLIENINSGRKYIGKKLFTKAGYKTVKGKKKKIRKKSDWENYYGSSPSLLADVELIGKDNFKRTILRLCKNRTECSYWEAREQFDRKVLESSDYYNDWISVRVRKSSLTINNK